jgi:4-alpha-glucanotransferase
LATLAGIETEYWDIFGNRHRTTPDVQRGILAAMGIDVSSPAAIEYACREFGEQKWRDALGPIQVLRRRGPLEVGIAVPDGADGKLQWRLFLEDGADLSGEVDIADLPVRETGTAGGKVRVRRALEFPESVPEGYHRLEIDAAGVSSGTALAVTPGAAYRGADGNGFRKWGLACQLYSVRSARDWGVGDFGTLAALATTAGQLGADAVGVNPLHALLTLLPERASPYMPSSRIFVNPIYIDIAATAALEGLEIGDAASQASALRRAASVDYPGVWALKRDAFARLFEAFERLGETRPDHPRRAAFERFRTEHGKALSDFCVFQALHEHFKGRAWPSWPSPFRDSNGAKVRMFARENQTAIAFHAYLQWIADEQLHAAAAAGEAAGMKIGLYRDLAVGSDPNGADAWMMRDQFGRGAKVGAPPDGFNPDGQDWGIPPPVPEISRRQGHASFIAAMRANMRHAGALRIDHAMSLHRLYWITPGAAASEGAYVRYPVEELLGLVALESHRNRCLVIGEDLGTVTDEFRELTNREGIYSYRVFYFERHGDGFFKRPDSYPASALATSGTHDLPTIRGHWMGRDVAWWAARSGKEDAADAVGQRARNEERNLIVAALRDQGLVDPEFPLEGGDEDVVRRLIVAIERFIARTPARLAMVNLDDALLEIEPINIPGTIDEYPNWRRRLSRPVEELPDDPFVRKLVSAVAAERRD